MDKNYLDMSIERLHRMYVICGRGGSIEELPGPITDNDRAFWESVVIETEYVKGYSSLVQNIRKEGCVVYN